MSKSAQNCHHLQAKMPTPLLNGCCYCADIFVQYCHIDMMSPGCHGIPKTRRHIWYRRIARWWHEFGWFMDGKGLVVKWMVDEMGRSELMLLIPLMICSWSGLAGANHLLLIKSTSGNKMVQLLTARKPSWICSKENHLVMVGGLLAYAFPRLQPLQLFPIEVGQTPSLKGQARFSWWLQDSSGRYQSGDTGQISPRNSSTC